MEKLEKALMYDRNQYELGYKQGIDEVIEEVETLLYDKFIENYNSAYANVTVIEEILEQMKGKYHIKTNADKFKEVFGFELDMAFIKKECILKCGETKPCEDCVKYNFWEKEYKELKK